ncbi:hypothetical protein CRENBAI_022762 [Crenichthys baileyi]|uniref:Ig-like domain-containing protein n=1 Tax=Crenichthys baileyi TaxID=28760 RepID=A0AAV9SB22_9TELE
MLPIMFYFRTLAALVALIITEVRGADPIYKRVGDSAVLNPGPLSDPISSAIWKHKSDLAMEWFGAEITCYRDFKDRCNLDQKSGSLIINNLKLGDSGSYSPEINNKELDKMELLVLQPVPKPAVSIQCNNEKTLCDLTCEAHITAEFGSVAYKWKNEDGELSNSKELEIKTEKHGSSFICELKNLVSSASSEAVTNPISSGINPAAVVVPVVIIILILIGAVAFLMYKKGYFTRLRKMGVGRTTSPDEEQGTQRTNGDVALEQEVPLLEGTNKGVEINNSMSDEALNGHLCAVSQGTRSQTEISSEMPKDPNSDQPADSVDVLPEPEGDVFPSDAMKTADQDQNSEQGPFSENHGEPAQDFKTEEAQQTSEGSEISLEMPKDPNCDQSVVSADVHREPANVLRSNEGSNQNLSDVTPETSSQTGDVRVDMEDEVQNSGVETERENLDQAEPAEESVAVEIPENRDGAEISSRKSSGEETPDRHTTDEDQS